MWVFTTKGFFSAVNKGGKMHVRFRSREQAESIRAGHAVLKGKRIYEDIGTDYAWRMRITKERFVALMTELAEAVDYPNFKNSAEGDDYHDMLMKVWNQHMAFQRANKAIERGTDFHDADRFFRFDEDDIRPKHNVRSKTRSVGVVLVNKDGRVLLIKPRGHFGGYAWTWPKGGVERGETDEEAALAELAEETGWLATIRGVVVGDFEGDTTVTTFFLGKPLRYAVELKDGETEDTRWATYSEATELIAQSENVAGADRDAAILIAARTASRTCGTLIR